MTEQPIGPILNWTTQRTESGEYWHPQFWSPVIDMPSDEAEYVEWYAERLIELNLECVSIALGEGYPEKEEIELRDRYADGDKDALKAWTPTVGPQGIGWFILALFETEDGPYVTWARIRPTQEASA